MKDIDMDVKKFMADFEEQKASASLANLSSALDDSASHVSSLDTKIYDQINSAFTQSAASKTKAEVLLW